MIRAAGSLLLGMALVVAAGLWVAHKLDPTSREIALREGRQRTVELVRTLVDPASPITELVKPIAGLLEPVEPKIAASVQREPEEEDLVTAAPFDVGAQDVQAAPDVPASGGVAAGLAAQGRTGAGPDVAPPEAAQTSATEPGAAEPSADDPSAVEPGGGGLGVMELGAIELGATEPAPADPETSVARIRRMLAVYRRTVEAER